MLRGSGVRVSDGQKSWLPCHAEEIRNGRKTSHWIWWVWPSLDPVRKTSRPQYSLRNLADVQAFLSDPGLRKNLYEITEVALNHLQKGVPAGTLFGSRTDVEKFGETATCFALASLEARDLQLAELMMSCLEALGGLHKETVKYLVSEGVSIASHSSDIDLDSLRDALARLQETTPSSDPERAEAGAEAGAEEAAEPAAELPEAAA